MNPSLLNPEFLADPREILYESQHIMGPWAQQNLNTEAEQTGVGQGGLVHGEHPRGIETKSSRTRCAIPEGKSHCKGHPWQALGQAHQRFTRKTCSISCRISSSRKTLRTSSRSMHCCLFMYFMAYIFSVSRFCTMQTWRAKDHSTECQKLNSSAPSTLREPGFLATSGTRLWTVYSLAKPSQVHPDKGES